MGSAVVNALEALRLLVEWGADEALTEIPLDRLQAPAATAAPPKPVPVETAPVRRAGAAERAHQLAQAADTPAALREAIAGFDGCALRDTAAHTVFADGDLAAPVLLIGEAPSADDDRAGRVFAGTDGELLDRLLGSVGLLRTDALIAPLLPWRPPGDRPPSAGELAACLPFLLRLIALSSARRALLLGPLAVRGVLGQGRRLPRGNWGEAVVDGRAAPLPVLASVSPAGVRASAARRREAWADLRMLRWALDRDIAKK